MFTEKRYHNFRTIEELSVAIKGPSSDSIIASNYIMTYGPLSKIADYVILNEDLLEICDVYKETITEELKLLLKIVLNLRGNHKYDLTASIQLEDLHILTKEAFEIFMNALKIVKHGLPEKDLIIYDSKFAVLIDRRHKTLSDISVSEAYTLVNKSKGYLPRTLEFLDKRTMIENLQEVKEELETNQFKCYRTIGQNRRELLEVFIKRVESELKSNSKT